MLMLEDLKKRTTLISSLESTLINNKYSCIVLDGKNPPSSTLEKNQIDECLSIFKQSEISLVGASHGMVIGPLFSLTIGEVKDTAFLKLYLTNLDGSSDVITEKTIQHDITMLAVAISILYSQIKKIEMPIIIEEFVNSECETKLSLNGSILSLK